MEIGAGMACMMVLDVRRIRLRTRLLAITDPASALHRRNLPQKTTRWGFDNAVLDRWSARVVGVWWFARAAICLAAALAMAAILSAVGWIFHKPPIPGSLFFFSPVLPVVVKVVLMYRKLLRKLHGDLATAEHLADEARLRDRLRAASGYVTAME
jgi:hypothetical protein